MHRGDDMAHANHAISLKSFKYVWFNYYDKFLHQVCLHKSLFKNFLSVQIKYSTWSMNIINIYLLDFIIFCKWKSSKFLFCSYWWSQFSCRLPQCQLISQKTKSEVIFDSTAFLIGWSFSIFLLTLRLHFNIQKKKDILPKTWSVSFLKIVFFFWIDISFTS